MSSSSKYSNAVSFDFEGLKLKELGPAGLDFASIAEIEVPCRTQHRKAHSTTCNKLYVCLEGQIRFSLNDEESILDPKDVLFIPKGEWFSYRNSSESTSARLLLIHVPPFNLEKEEFE